MIEEKSIAEIVSIIERKILFVILEQLPTPSCPRKKQQNEWKIEQVKLRLAQKLNDEAGAK